MRKTEVREYFAHEVDCVDASVFSGDILFVTKERELLKSKCEKWLNAINEFESDEESMELSR